MSPVTLRSSGEQVPVEQDRIAGLALKRRSDDQGALLPEELEKVVDQLWLD